MGTLPEQLRLDIQQHTAVITLDNPPANTWTAEMLSALPGLVSQLNQNTDIYSLILTGSGDNFFSAGAQLQLFADGNAELASEIAQAFGIAFTALSRFRGVSIAAINGFAMGGGLEAALACDIRIVETQARLGLPEASVGLLPCGGGTQKLAWLVGEGWAKRMILCGEHLDAETAWRIGLVEELVATAESLDKALYITQQVSRQSPRSVSYCKELIELARDMPLNEALDRERQRFVELFGTEDQREGVNAFLQKRQPQWKNR